jgi:hypothetical protein
MILDEKLPKYLLGKYQLIGTVTFSVLFALVFLLIYIPFSDTAWFGLGGSGTFSHTLIFAFGTILFLSLSRILMYRSKRHFEMQLWMYIAWCALEIIIICTTYSSMTIDMSHPDGEIWWEVFRRAIVYGSIALGGPYLISGMYFNIIDKDNIIKLMTYENVVTEEPPKPNSTTQKITLFDNSGSLKLSLSPENLYYIESDDNYIKVWYTDNKGELKQYMLRCRLKTVEESFKDTGLVRCHRKYIVNIKKVKVLRKESEGYVLDLDNEEIQPLTVTKTYTDSVLSHFTGESPLLEPIDY